MFSTSKLPVNCSAELRLKMSMEHSIDPSSPPNVPSTSPAIRVTSVMPGPVSSPCEPKSNRRQHISNISMMSACATDAWLTGNKSSVSSAEPCSRLCSGANEAWHQHEYLLPDMQQSSCRMSHAVAMETNVVKQPSRRQGDCYDTLGHSLLWLQRLCSYV